VECGLVRLVEVEDLARVRRTKDRDLLVAPAIVRVLRVFDRGRDRALGAARRFGERASVGCTLVLDVAFLLRLELRALAFERLRSIELRFARDGLNCLRVYRVTGGDVLGARVALTRELRVVVLLD